MQVAGQVGAAQVSGGTSPVETDAAGTSPFADLDKRAAGHAWEAAQKKTQSRMSGAAEQFQYILRDASMHCNFGIDAIDQLELENPQRWTQQFREEIADLVRRAAELEYRYGKTPRGAAYWT